MMKTKRKQWLQKITAMVCVFGLLSPVLQVRADDLGSLESRSSDLQGELDNINDELLKIGEQIAGNEAELEAVNNDIIRTEEQLQIAKNNEDAHYDDMKDRIQYIYENDGESLLGMIFSATSLSDFINKIHFVQKVSEYDRGMFNELKDLRQTIEDEETYLKEQKESFQEMEKELNAKREELNAKAAETSTSLETLQSAIAAMKAEQAAKTAAEQAAQTSSPSVNNQSNTGNGTGSSGGNGSGSSHSDNSNSGNGGSGNNHSGGGYIYPSGPGQLNPWVGVVYFNGHRETYYSQKVLPGGGLNIPGRHVASDGTIRDANGYICVASSDYPKGTIVETSLGTGMVYDSGCASGTIDIYTDW